MCRKIRCDGESCKILSVFLAKQGLSLGFLTATAAAGPTSMPSARDHWANLAHTVTYRGQIRPSLASSPPSRVVEPQPIAPGRHEHTCLKCTPSLHTQTHRRARIRTSTSTTTRSSRVPPSRAITSASLAACVRSQLQRRGKEAQRPGGAGRNRESHSSAAALPRSRAREAGGDVTTEEAVVVRPATAGLRRRGAGECRPSQRRIGLCPPLGAIPGAVGPRR